MSRGASERACCGRAHGEDEPRRPPARCRGGEAAVHPPSRAHRTCTLPALFPDVLDQLTYATLELVTWACFITSETYCGIPSQLVVGDEAPDAPFRASATFRTLARQYGAHGRIKDTVSIHRTAAQRREAADTAVTLVAGLSQWSTDFLYQ